MPRKKIESTVKDVTELNIFPCQELIHEIEIAAEKNDGEITDEQLQQLVEAQTQVPAKLYSLCNFLKLLEAKDRACKTRIAEIKEEQIRAEKLYDRLSASLALFVDRHFGKRYICEEYDLKTRISKSVKVPDDFDDPFYCTRQEVVKITPDKRAIRKALEAGEEVLGCELIEKINLIIK